MPVAAHRRYLTEGIHNVVYADEHGAEHNPVIRLIGCADPSAKDFLAVNQVVVTDGEHKRLFDVVLYVNGMPFAMVVYPEVLGFGIARLR